MNLNFLQLYGLITVFNAYFISDHICKKGYTLVTQFGPNQICGTLQFGSAGEDNMGGPNWPNAETTADASEQACATNCDERSSCAYYMWFNNKGCRMQTSCEETVGGYSSTISYICMKGFNYNI